MSLTISDVLDYSIETIRRQDRRKTSRAKDKPEILSFFHGYEKREEKRKYTSDEDNDHHENCADSLSTLNMNSTILYCRYYVILLLRIIFS